MNKEILSIDFVNRFTETDNKGYTVLKKVPPMEIIDWFLTLSQPSPTVTDEEIERQIEECGLSKVPEGQQFWEGAKWMQSRLSQPVRELSESTEEEIMDAACDYVIYTCGIPTTLEQFQDALKKFWKFFPERLSESQPVENTGSRIHTKCDECGDIFDGTECNKCLSQPVTGYGEDVRNLELHKQITFDELVKHGLQHGANIHNGMPWSWKINGKVITHENDNCYIIQTIEGMKHFHRGESLIAFDGGLKILINHGF